MLSSESAHYRQAFEGFQEEWGSPVPVSVGRASDEARDAIVAFGSRASLLDFPSDTLLVTCMAPGARPYAEREVLRVELLPEPALLLARLKKLFPGLKVLRVLWTSSFEDPEVGALTEAGQALGVRILSERVTNPARLPEKLRGFTGPADALWLMPDPALVNAVNFEVLKEYAAAKRVPFLAPTEGLAEKGATATLAAPFREVGRTAAVALKRRLDGDELHLPAHPRRLVVTVNAAAARAIGLTFGPDAGVDRTLP